MWKDSQLIDHVITPDDVRVFQAGFNRGSAALRRLPFIQDDVRHHVLVLGGKRAIVAISHTLDVQAQDLAPAAYDVNPVSFDGG